MSLVVLGIETSGKSGGAAVCKDGCLVAQKFLPANTLGEKNLVPAVSDLLAENRFCPRDFDAVAVSAGPGSYTGMRVGITTAKTLCWALDIPAVPVGSLAVLASGAPEGDEPFVLPVVKAYRGMVYARVFYRSSVRGVPKAVTDNMMLTPEQAAELPQGNAVAFGPDMSRFADTFERAGIRVSRRAVRPRPADVCLIGAELLERGLTVPAHDLVPEYLREFVSGNGRKR